MEGNKKPFRKGLEAAVLALVFSAAVPVENTAEAQNQRVAPIENKYEARAEGVRESVGRVKKQICTTTQVVIQEEGNMGCSL